MFAIRCAKKRSRGHLFEGEEEVDSVGTDLVLPRLHAELALLLGCVGDGDGLLHTARRLHHPPKAHRLHIRLEHRELVVVRPHCDQIMNQVGDTKRET